MFIFYGQKHKLTTATISVDFFFKKANSRGREFFHKLCFPCIRCPRKNLSLLVKYYLGDHYLKIIEISYTRGGQYCSYERPHLKKFAAEGRTEWKSKKKIYPSADVPFSPLKIGEEQKKYLSDRSCPFFH